jgi:hypothetical protein
MLFSQKNIVHLGSIIIISVGYYYDTAYWLYDPAQNEIKG